MNIESIKFPNKELIVRKRISRFIKKNILTINPNIEVIKSVDEFFAVSLFGPLVNKIGSIIESGNNEMPLGKILLEF